jgi:hypothetical protein
VEGAHSPLECTIREKLMTFLPECQETGPVDEKGQFLLLAHTLYFLSLYLRHTTVETIEAVQGDANSAQTRAVQMNRAVDWTPVKSQRN